jgi:hypothetical protein
MPPGAVPPFVVRFDAGSVPIAQLVFSTSNRSPGEMQDFAINRVRHLFATLTVLPAFYAIVQRRASTQTSSLHPMDPRGRFYEPR